MQTPNLKMAVAKSLRLGFTVMELIIVVGIIGVVLTVTSTATNNIRARMRDSQRIADVKMIQTALAAYKSDNGFYPTQVTPNLALVGPNGKTYMKAIPAAPGKRDGKCAEDNYTFTSLDNSNNYRIDYCLGWQNGPMSPGSTSASPGESTHNFKCGTETVADAYDAGVSYQTVWLEGVISTNGKIDPGECWMKDNLRTTKGGTLVHGTGMSYPQISTLLSNTPEDNPTYLAQLGYLYDWNIALDLPSGCQSYDSGVSTCPTWSEPRKGLCPNGWHIPSDIEWNNVEKYYWNGTGLPCTTTRLGNGCNTASYKLGAAGTDDTSKIPWFDTNDNGSNAAGVFNDSSGLSIRAAGYGYDHILGNDRIFNRGTSAQFWTSKSATSNAIYRAISGYMSGYVVRDTAGKSLRHSIRCVKD